MAWNISLLTDLSEVVISSFLAKYIFHSTITIYIVWEIIY
jgi:hypothetical protein